jgi:cobalt-zinc-cadmium efflux system membrane fusion protein
MTMSTAPLRVVVPLLFLSTAAGSCRGSAPPEPAAELSQAEADATTPETPDRVTLTPAAISEAGIQTWEVKPVDLTHLLTLNGTVEHDERRLVQVAANVRGRVTRMPLDLGARVPQGAVVAEIESLELGRAREEFLRELHALRAATRVYERAKVLVDGKAISAGEFQAREGDYLARRAAADAAERALHLLGDADAQIARLRAAVESEAALPPGDAPRLSLRAPFGGRVVDRKVTTGSLVEALQPLVTLADLSSVRVFLQAYEKDLAVLTTGLAVTIRADAYPQESFAGRLDFIGGVVDEATRTVRVRATVPNPTERLRPGMFVRGQVDIPSLHTRPHPTLQTLDGHQTVLVQLAPGVFGRRTVEPGHTLEGMTEILAGVKLGDVIVTEGSFVLKSEFAKALLAEDH